MFQYLKPRVDGLENKNREENSRNDTQDRRVENIDRHRDGEDDIIHRIKIDPPILDDILELKIFGDWIADLVTILIGIGSQRRVRFGFLG